GGGIILQKRIRHLQRYRVIVIAFSRNGLGYRPDEVGLYDLVSLPRRIVTNEAHGTDRNTTGERIRLFLEELGPTFVKLGQFASTRPDILPEHIIQELNKLQDDATPFSYEDVKTIIESELNQPIDSIFLELKQKPLAAASI